MPSNKILEQKKAVVEELAAKIQSAAAGVLVKYEGITVAEDTELRAALRKAGVPYHKIIQRISGIQPSGYDQCAGAAPRRPVRRTAASARRNTDS